MHIPDGWINLPTSAAAAGLAAAAVAVSGRRAAARLRERTTTTPAVVAAYLLVAELLVVPLGLGTGAHLIGTGLAAVLVGPEVAIVCVAVVVVIQALVLADGGVTAIGLNVLNNGVVPALVAATAFGATWTAARRARRFLPVAAGLAAALATLAAGGAAALEFAVGGTHVVPARAVATALGAGHLVVAVVEGILTALVVRIVDRLRPDLIASRPHRRERPTSSVQLGGIYRPNCTLDPRRGRSEAPAPATQPAGGGADGTARPEPTRPEPTRP
ncbi:MAG: cobalt/nickel transport system permease protein [Actinomycetota bacterium]|nr:cobalt/nickel transport system permease protein [Actinomycetota bacterium]